MWSYTCRAKAKKKRIGEADVGYLIRRLIITGEGSPTNLTALLCSMWESKAGNIVEKTRIDNHIASEHLDMRTPC